MNDDNHRPEPDVLNQAVEALRDAPTPAGPPAERTAATLAAIRDRLTGTVPGGPARELQRRRRIMRYIHYGTVSTAVAVLVRVLVLVARPESAIAFDRVRDEVKKADAATYVDTQVDQQGYATQIKYFNRGKQVRMELVKSGNVYVFDYAERKALSVAPSLQAYELYDIPEEDADDQAAQFVAEVKRLLKGAAVETGTVKVDGVGATAFTIAGGTMYGCKADYRVLVDPQTALPVRISCERKPTGPDDASFVKRTFGQFDWNPKLADELFSLDPPKGYTEGIPGFVKPVVPAKKK